MLLCGANSTPYSYSTSCSSSSSGISSLYPPPPPRHGRVSLASRRIVSFKTELNRRPYPITVAIRLGSCALAAAAAAMMLTLVGANAMEPQFEDSETLSNIPQQLSGECILAKDCKKARIQKPKSREAESCTIKCVTTCIRGGDGEGPLNVRRLRIVEDLKEIDRFTPSHPLCCATPFFT